MFSAKICGGIVAMMFPCLIFLSAVRVGLWQVTMIGQSQECRAKKIKRQGLFLAGCGLCNNTLKDFVSPTKVPLHSPPFLGFLVAFLCLTGASSVVEFSAESDVGCSNPVQHRLVLDTLG